MYNIENNIILYHWKGGVFINIKNDIDINEETKKRLRKIMKERFDDIAPLGMECIEVDREKRKEKWGF